MKKPKTEKQLKEQILKFTKMKKTVEIDEISSGLHLDMGLVCKLCNELMVEGKMTHHDYQEEYDDT